MFILLGVSVSAFAQSRMHPVVKSYGGIFDIPYAEEKPDPTLDYKIIIEIATARSEEHTSELQSQ